MVLETGRKRDFFRRGVPGCSQGRVQLSLQSHPVDTAAQHEAFNSKLRVRGLSQADAWGQS